MRVLAGGCFNHIHLGHVYFLKKCKRLGSELWVVLANDQNNKKVNAKASDERFKDLDNLKIADKILIGESVDMLGLLNEINPGLICLGFDQVLPMPVLPYIKKKGVKVSRIEQLKNYQKNYQKFIGKIFSGQRRASRFLSTPYYKEKLKKITDEYFFEGTLNIRVSNRNFTDLLDKSKFLKIPPHKNLGGLTLYPIKLNAKLKNSNGFNISNLNEKAWVVIPNKTSYNKDVVEILHTDNLREKYGLQDDNILEITIQ